MKGTGLISFDKLRKNKIKIKHTFGELQYNFDNFAEKNKYYISPEFKQLFQIKGFDYLDRHDYKVESVNRFYKSDIYRNVLVTFLNKTPLSDTYFLNCFNYSNTDSKNMSL